MRRTPGGRPLVLYLVTAQVSTQFSRGQLAFLHRHGFDVALATRISNPGTLAVDDVARSFDLPFVREPAPIADLKALVATTLLLRRLRPTIVHAGTPKAGLLGMLAAWVTRRPIRIYALHGLRYESLEGRRRRVMLALERLAVACSTHVIADSPSIVAQGNRDRIFGSAECFVIRKGSSNGVDTARFHPQDRRAARQSLGIDDHRLVIGFVGRLTRDKGIEDLLFVLDALTQQGRELALLLVGDQEPGDPLSPQTTARIGSDDRIIHVPWTSAPELAYGAMDVLVFPSYREGLPNVPLEAQACGIPVVGYRATGTVDAVTVGGSLVEVGDAEALTSTVAHLLDDEAARSQIGAAGRSFVEKEFEQEVVWQRRAEMFREWMTVSGDGRT